MNIDQLIDKFLTHLKDDRNFRLDSLARYKYILEIYRDFTISKIGIKGEEVKSHLNDVDEKDIFSSLDHYINKCKVRAEDTANFFISVIKNFLQYLKEKNIIDNSAIFESFGRSPDDPSSFSHLLSEELKLKSFKYKKNGRALNEHEISTLIKYCDDEINKYLIDKLIKSNEKYNNFVRAIMVKLTIYTGIKNIGFNTIMYSDYSFEKGTIKINGYEILLPSNLKIQMKKYIDLRTIKNNIEGNLFLEYDGKLDTGTGKLGTFILKCLEQFDDLQSKSSMICVAKYTIMEMIRNGVNQNIIQDLTGYKTNVFYPCQELVNLEKTEEKSKYLRKKLKLIDTFDIL